MEGAGEEKREKKGGKKHMSSGERGGEKYGRVMVENPSSELKRDVVKLNNVCNIYTRECFIRVQKYVPDATNMTPGYISV